MRNYEVIVSNVGTVFQSANPVAAMREYAECKALSLDNYGRMAGETVTVMQDGEPWREFDPHAGCYFAEVTDTFSGEANYSWVRRYRIRASSQRGAIGKLSRHENYSFAGEWDDGDTKRYKVRGACICAFVSHWDKESHSQYSITNL